MGVFSALFLYGFPLYHEDLSSMGKIEIGVEFGGGPNFAGFDPAMVRGITSNEIRFVSFLEIELEILQESGLICFDGEEVVGLALSDEVLCDAALGP